MNSQASQLAQSEEGPKAPISAAMVAMEKAAEESRDGSVHSPQVFTSSKQKGGRKSAVELAEYLKMDDKDNDSYQVYVPTFLERLVSHSLFDGFFGLLIVTNAGCIGAEVEFKAT